jgi:Mg2+-importing ATPase
MLSVFTGDLRAAGHLHDGGSGAGIAFFQELRADKSAEKLQAMVSNTATVVRGGKEEELPLRG